MQDPTGTQTTLPSTSRLSPAFKSKLWDSANALRGHLDAAEYKHTVLGLIFPKYISDAFEAHHATLAADVATGADPEDKDEYLAKSIVSMPSDSRWPVPNRWRSAPWPVTRW